MNRISLLILLLLFMVACGPINSFEKNVSIPGQEWASSFKPVISFDISDTTSLYNVYVVIRHKNAYRFNNREGKPMVNQLIFWYLNLLRWGDEEAIGLRTDGIVR